VLVFFQDIQTFVASRQIILGFSTLFYYKGDFGVAATLFKILLSSFKPMLVSLLVSKALLFQFYFRWLWFHIINNFKFLWYDYLSIAGK
jgi:hypothetical protein